MIQDILPEKINNHYEHLQPDSDDRVLFFQQDRFLTAYDDKSKNLIFPTWKEFKAPGRAVYLFSVGEERFFLLTGSEEVPAEYDFYGPRDLRGKPRNWNRDIFIIYTAWHLAKWYQSARYCGCCGEKTEHDTVERAMVCPKCGQKIYPRINPAVIVGVTNGDKIVLTRYNANFAYNALIAGFTEIGETMEETVQREVMEEVGLRVNNIRYYKSQPWGIAADILMGYYCEVDGDDTIHRDDSELKYAEWVAREDIELQPDNLSLTNEMMYMFKTGQQP